MIMLQARALEPNFEPGAELGTKRVSRDSLSGFLATTILSGFRWGVVVAEDTVRTI